MIKNWVVVRGGQRGQVRERERESVWENVFSIEGVVNSKKVQKIFVNLEMKENRWWRKREKKEKEKQIRSWKTKKKRKWVKFKRLDNRERKSSERITRRRTKRKKRKGE